MAVNIDSVYQKVLTLANKEQRGYITPQQFNLMADKAQKDIINNYFHKIKTAYYKPKNQTEASDEAEMLQEKMSYIRAFVDIEVENTAGIAWLALPADLYKIATLRLKSLNSTSISIDSPIEIEEIDEHTLSNAMQNPLTKPTYNRPVYTYSYPSGEDSDDDGAVDNYNASGNYVWLSLHPASQEENDKGIHHGDTVTVSYWKSPQKPEWGYVVVNGKALYNTNTSRDFPLHPTEEEPLVTRILQLFGVIIEKPQLSQAASLDALNTSKIQNS